MKIRFIGQSKKGHWNEDLTFNSIYYLEGGGNLFTVLDDINEVVFINEERFSEFEVIS